MDFNLLYWNPEWVQGTNSHLQQVVNNKPKEKKIVSDNGGLAAGSRNLCNDVFDNEEATCGHQKDTKGNNIWDSQVTHLLTSNLPSIHPRVS